MWTDDDLIVKENIENAAKRSLEGDLKRWWDDQEYKKKENCEYKIIPFLIWKKRN